MAKPTLKEVFIDFIFQDTSLMDRLLLGLPIYSRTEITIRCLFLLLLILVLWSILRPENVAWIMVLIFISHFINWFFNGHGYQIFYRTIDMRYSAHKAINYVLRLKEECERRGLHAMIYGSWARGEASKNSDIDIFIVNVQGSTLKGLRLGLISLKYRILALIMLLSVDIYVIDKVAYLEWRSKVKPEEKPIILNDPTRAIINIYKRETELEEFIKRVSEHYH
uniref:Polymerase nucleotidyl transferase domain-containing protein n=1 Tax=Ignisphaera aggregans TaxID=334771 RepID=A0A7J3YTP0_9CREN